MRPFLCFLRYLPCAVLLAAVAALYPGPLLSETDDEAFRDRLEWFGKMEASGDLRRFLGELQHSALSETEKNAISAAVNRRCQYLKSGVSLVVAQTLRADQTKDVTLDELKRQLLEDSAKPFGQRTYANPKAISLLLARCEGLVGPSFKVSAASERGRDEPKEPLDLAMDWRDKGRGDEAEKIVKTMLEGRLPEDIASLAMYFEGVPATIDADNAEIENTAWTLAACQFGMGCEPGSLTALVYCTISLRFCDDTTELRDLLWEIFPSDRLLLAEARAAKIVDSLRRGEVDRLLRLEHREGTDVTRGASAKK